MAAKHRTPLDRQSHQTHQTSRRTQTWVSTLLALFFEDSPSLNCKLAPDTGRWRPTRPASPLSINVSPSIETRIAAFSYLRSLSLNGPPAPSSIRTNIITNHRHRPYYIHNRHLSTLTPTDHTNTTSTTPLINRGLPLLFNEEDTVRISRQLVVVSQSRMLRKFQDQYLKDKLDTLWSTVNRINEDLLWIKVFEKFSVQTEYTREKISSSQRRVLESMRKECRIIDRINNYLSPQ